MHLLLIERSCCAQQVGGGQPRWELYHHLHLMERTVKRLPASSRLGETSSTVGPSSPSWHAVNVHLPWAMPVLLQLIQCLHTLWTPEVQLAAPHPFSCCRHLSIVHVLQPLVLHRASVCGVCPELS